MEQVLASDARFWGATDDETVQNAVNYAEKAGLGEITIPRRNERTGENLWNFHKAVLLPSDMTVYLAGCHLRHGDDTEDNLFRNKNCWVNPNEAQQEIRIIGLGNAVMDGGKGNGSSEQRCRDNPGKHKNMVYNCAVHFSNVTRFEIRGIRFRETRYWALCFHYCSWGHLEKLHFENTGIYENQDGIDLRTGCEFITVAHITGVTGDDTLALTALPAGKAETALRPKNASADIHDITVEHITAATHGCGVLRLLCEGGARIYNVTAQNIKDTTDAISGTAVMLGTMDGVFCDEKRRPEHMKNIVLRNITTCAQRGITLGEGSKNVVIENLFTYGPNQVGVRLLDNFTCDNMVIRNVSVCSQAEALDCAISLPYRENRVLKGLKIENLTVGKANYIFRGTQLPVENLQAERPKLDVFSPEVPPLVSAYSRYHKAFFGTTPVSRPQDNRFDGTLKTREELARE